jgi:hypothetical protein
MQDCQVKNIYEGFPASHAANKLLTCLQSDNEICKKCSEKCKLSHRCSSLLILSKTTLGGSCQAFCKSDHRKLHIMTGFLQ